MKTFTFISLFAASATAFPWVVNQEGVDATPLSGAYKAAKIRRQQSGGSNPGGPDTCPFNARHVPAAPFDARFPYNGARNGRKGNERGGYLVPAPGDDAHQFIAPGPNDIRGPCPGLNVAANHNFLARDGIVTYNELVDAQQNLYNVGFDLANLLAVLGLQLTDGDIITQRLSIGCDATTRTSFNPLLTGSQPGLSGHNKFEADSSLTRNDFFPAGGDNFRFNGTLFTQMANTCNNLFDLDGLAQYRYERYQDSLQNNPNFYFGPLSLLLYGAASFLYELMPSGTRNYVPDIETISSFFGAQETSPGSGIYEFNNQERLPPNWTNRIEPYNNRDVTIQIVAMYLKRPVLFGGATGPGGFNALPKWSNVIENGEFTTVAPENTVCFLYQLATQSIPSSLNGIVTPTVEVLAWALTKLTGMGFENLGCPIPLT